MNIRIKGTADQGGISATIGFFIGFAAVSLFGITAVKLKDVLGVSLMQMGLLISAPALSGALLRIPFAAWVDTVGGRKPFLILLCSSILGMAGLYYMISHYYPHHLNASHYPWLVFLGVLSGCGIATFSVGIGQVSYWFPLARQGRVLGLYAGIANLAPGIFALILPFALEAFGLAGCYLAWLIFLVIGTFVYFLTGCNSPYFQYRQVGMSIEEAKIAAQKVGQEIFPKGNVLESLSISARRWKTWVLVALYFTSFGGFVALTAWFPTYWKASFGVTIVVAGALTALYSISACCFRVLGGIVSDHFGGERTLIVSFVIMSTGALLMTQANILSLAIVASLFLALGMGFANAATFKIVPQAIPDAVGGAAGWIGGLGTLGGFFIPPLLGVIVATKGQTGYAQGFYILLGLSIISLILSFILIKSYRK